MTNENTPDFYKSRTRLKNEAKALQKLGERLLKLTPGQLAAIEIPHELREAVKKAREISSHKASARQLQYIGAIMRECDPDPIIETLKRLETGLAVASKEKAPQGPEEVWVNRILQEEEALEAFLSQFPSADRQRLRQLKRNTLKQHGKPAEKKVRRTLYEAVSQAMKRG